MTPVIKLRVSNIEKSFPGVKALDKVSLAIKKGSVHAICGENGAGKSTLMKVIIGITRPDAGQIFIDEKPVQIRHPIAARHLGISMIFQELAYAPQMTVAESFCVGQWPRCRFGNVDWKQIRARASALLAQEHLSYAPHTRLRDLSISDIQMLEIVKAVSHNADLIIMDEPTSAITAAETETLFAKIHDLRARGKSILYISHKLDEIFRLADDITVLRDGGVIDSRPKDQYDPDTLITQMVGRKLEHFIPQETSAIGAQALRVDHLSRAGIFHDVSFHVHQGEIIGFAGLVGAGRTDVLRAVFGLAPADSGEIFLHNRKVRIQTVADSIACKMVMLSEDRRRYGIIPVRSVRENVALATLQRFLFRGRHHAALESRTVQQACQSMNVKTPTLETAAATLSGGNQQKLLLARWMLTNPDILLLDEPTRGIDVGAKHEIYKLMRALAAQNKALVMVSSELPELLAMCDRIYIMAQGRITGMLAKNQFSQEHIMAYATGVKQQPEGSH